MEHRQILMQTIFKRKQFHEREIQSPCEERAARGPVRNKRQPWLDEAAINVIAYSHWEGKNNSVPLKTPHENSEIRTRDAYMTGEAVRRSSHCVTFTTIAVLCLLVFIGQFRYLLLRHFWLGEDREPVELKLADRQCMWQTHFNGAK